ncbi:hypothetical protein [Kluyvera intermedia]|uniref:hypothetical protein n=1 Tax=Kluyvera intermedia TaxID=61648 RepID=UPI00370AB41B
MGFENLIAICIAGLGFLWTMFRDKSGDMEEILERISSLEGKVQNHSTDISRLEKGQDELEDGLRSLQDQIHKMDLKIERILTILEKNKGL